MMRVERVHVDAVIAHGNADHPRAAAQKHVAQSRINRVFEQHRFAVRSQHALDQIEGLLAAAGDQDIVIRARDAPLARLFQQIPPQRTIAAGGAELENLRGFGRIDHLAAGGAKFVQRKQHLRRPRSRETDLRNASARGVAGAFHRQESAISQSSRAGVSRSALHETSPPHVPSNQALRFQQLVSRRNGGSIQSKEASQFPCWRELFSPGEHSREDRRANVLIDLHVKRRFGLGIELDARKHANLQTNHTILGDGPGTGLRLPV